jgi:hypothetical protein
MAQQKPDEHDQQSVSNQKSSSVQCPQCLNESGSINNRTKQNLQSANSGLSTNIEKAGHLSGNDSIVLCSEHSRDLINPTGHHNKRDNIVTDSNNDSKFEDVLNGMIVEKRRGNREKSLKNCEKLEEMKFDPLLESQQPFQVEHQN